MGGAEAHDYIWKRRFVWKASEEKLGQASPEQALRSKINLLRRARTIQRRSLAEMSEQSFTREAWRGTLNEKLLEEIFPDFRVNVDPFMVRI